MNITELLSEMPAMGDINMESLHVVITQSEAGGTEQTVKLSVRQLQTLINAIQKADESRRLAF